MMAMKSIICISILIQKVEQKKRIVLAHIVKTLSVYATFGYNKNEIIMIKLLSVMRDCLFTYGDIPIFTLHI